MHLGDQPFQRLVVVHKKLLNFLLVGMVLVAVKHIHCTPGEDGVLLDNPAIGGLVPPGGGTPDGAVNGTLTTLVFGINAFDGTWGGGQEIRNKKETIRL